MTPLSRCQSHIIRDILNLCEQRNIIFICLPPNATHIMQQLDVAFFGPLKWNWHLVLSKWHDTEDGSKYPTIPNEKLAALLKKFGIVPVDKQILMNRLPNATGEINSEYIF
ncbi:hypothetical protein PR048_006402 [Dryococelus australis]|uniref:DDE-1 domain-containing protein n=1 Tax=Dryococelus australis TaxID=614101 RepID=A0ABQ9IAX6_9NEOP|nr:hypothetical protein PR048_006402 [Dryococelus australis]